MQTAKALSITGLGLMLVGILYALFTSDAARDFGVILALPAGQVTTLDLYVGFLLFWGWVVYREQNWLRSLGWLVVFLVLGNLATCFYLFLALRASGGDWQKFWMGAAL